MKKSLPGLLCLLLAAAQPCLSAPKTAITVQVKPDTLQPADAVLLEAAGITTVRFGVYYSPSLDALGQKAPEWARYDHLFSLLKQHHIRVLMTAYTPPAVIDAQLQDAHAPKVGDAYKPEAVRVQLHHDLDTLVRNAVQRYGDQIVAIEFWNEPDNRRFWTTVPALGGFASAMSGICDTAKTWPKVPLYGYGFIFLPGGENTTTPLYDELRKFGGATNCLAATSGHFYRDHAELVIKEVEEARKYTGGEIVVTEHGASALPGKRTDVEQADVAMRMLLSSVLAKMPLASIYEFKDTADATPEREKHFGAIRSDGTRKPLYEALHNFVPLYNAAAQTNGQCDGEFCRMDFKGPSGAYALFWRETAGSTPLSKWLHQDEIDSKLLRSTDDFYTSSPEIIMITQSPLLVRLSK